MSDGRAFHEGDYTKPAINNTQTFITVLCDTGSFPELPAVEYRLGRGRKSPTPEKITARSKGVTITHEIKLDIDTLP
jgi:hypothetical protein